MTQHIRDAADTVIRNLGDYPQQLDGLHAREFLSALAASSVKEAIEFVHEAISEAGPTASGYLWRYIETNDDTALGETVRLIVEWYAILKIGNRHLEWQPADLDEEPGPPEEVAADNRERVLAVREVLR